MNLQDRYDREIASARIRVVLSAIDALESSS